MSEQHYRAEPDKAQSAILIKGECERADDGE
jgi:hypothetical protein